MQYPPRLSKLGGQPPFGVLNLGTGGLPGLGVRILNPLDLPNKIAANSCQCNTTIIAISPRPIHKTVCVASPPVSMDVAVCLLLAATGFAGQSFWNQVAHYSQRFRWKLC